MYQPPGLADRMVPVDPRRLSSCRELSSRPRTASTDPMQRFFDWDAAIGPAGTISSRLVLVASRQRALDLLEGVQSNGVRLLDHGLVRFVGAVPDDIETHGALVLVVPSLVRPASSWIVGSAFKRSLSMGTSDYIVDATSSRS